jgi:hypothetical protein
VAAATLLLGVLLPPALFMRSAAPILPHFLVFLSPLLFLLEAVGIATAGASIGGLLPASRPVAPSNLRPGPRPLGRFCPLPGGAGPEVRARSLPCAVAGLLVLALAATAVVRLATFDAHLAEHVSGGDYGTPLRYTLRAATLLAVPVAAEPTNPSPGPTLAIELAAGERLRQRSLAVTIEPTG